MGMYDHIICELPLPHTNIKPDEGEGFQTKDTPDQWLTTYTITKKGQLSWRPYEMITVPEKERPFYNEKNKYSKLFGMLKKIESAPEVLTDFHKDIIFYQFKIIKNQRLWWEYKARFTSGFCEKIELLKYEATYN